MVVVPDMLAEYGCLSPDCTELFVCHSSGLLKGLNRRLLICILIDVKTRLLPIFFFFFGQNGECA